MNKVESTKYYCDHCNKDVNETDVKCPHCGSDISNEIEQIETAPMHFKGMVTLGNLLDTAGWFIGIIGIIAISYFIMEIMQSNSTVLALFPALIGIIIVLIFALFLIAAGQFLLCNVSIEKNGRQTNIILMKLVEQKKEKQIIVKMNP